MGQAAVPAAIVGSQVVGALLKGSGTKSQHVPTRPVQIKLPSGGTITAYATAAPPPQVPDNGAGAILGNAIQAGGQAYGMYGMLGGSGVKPDVPTLTATPPPTSLPPVSYDTSFLDQYRR